MCMKGRRHPGVMHTLSRVCTPESRWNELRTRDFRGVRIGGELRFTIAGDKGGAKQEAFVAAVVRSRSWLDRILSGDAASQRDLSAKEGMDQRYVSRLLPLAFLSPEITEAILDGTQPQHWCLDTLLGKVPLDWQDQRKFLV